MMSRQDELERYEQTEARDLIRLMKASEPQEELRAPPDFRLNVLRKIEERRSRRSLFSWPAVAFVPGWAPALAALLVLSLGVNVWLGSKALGPSKPVAVEVAANTNAPLRPVPAYVFQKGIRPDADLGALVAAQSPEDKPVTYSFAGKTSSEKSFFIGTLYAEALAHLRSGNLEAATQRWQMLDQALGQTAEPLLSYQRDMQGWLQQEPLALERFAASLPLFESFYEVYTAGEDNPSLPLFQIGAWTTNMRLAAEASDVDGLRRGQAVDYFLARLDGPKGVEDGLRRLGDLMEKDSLNKRELHTVIKLVKKMQQILG